jgi:NADH pyrophosphatase NudC (nudix superfamily)
MSKYLLVPVVAGCVIQKDDKYLLVQEKQQKAYGLWNLPAGHVDEGETLEVAARREALEETGFVVELDKKLEVEHPDISRPVLHAYQAHILSGELTINTKELLDVRWFTLEEIKRLQAAGKLRNDWVVNSIKQV